MAKHKPRLYVTQALFEGLTLSLTPAHSHHLAAVLRLKAGDEIDVFNGRDGVWCARLDLISRKSADISLRDQKHTQIENAKPLWVYLAGIRKTRFDWAVEKLAEIGVHNITPLITEFTQYRKFQTNRLQKIAIEACEQCRGLTVPKILPAQPLTEVCGRIDTHLIIPDEASVDIGDGPADELPPLISVAATLTHQAVAVIIGPEGGFSPSERAIFAALETTNPPRLQRVSLGPRVLRSETAAIVAAAILQTTRI